MITPAEIKAFRNNDDHPAPNVLGVAVPWLIFYGVIAVFHLVG